MRPYFDFLISRQNRIALYILTGIFLTACNSGPYKGDLYSGEPHGYGTYIYPDGSKYEGQFRYGRKYGFGTFTTADGKVSKVAYHSGKQIHTEEQIKYMLQRMRFIDESVERNRAIRAASDRADLRAIEKDRKRRNSLPDYNSFRNSPNYTVGSGSKNAYTQGGDLIKPSGATNSSHQGNTNVRNKKLACDIKQVGPLKWERENCDGPSKNGPAKGAEK